MSGIIKTDEFKEFLFAQWCFAVAIDPHRGSNLYTPFAQQMLQKNMFSYGDYLAPAIIKKTAGIYYRTQSPLNSYPTFAYAPHPRYLMKGLGHYFVLMSFQAGEGPSLFPGWFSMSSCVALTFRRNTAVLETMNSAYQVEYLANTPEEYFRFSESEFDWDSKEWNSLLQKTEDLLLTKDRWLECSKSLISELEKAQGYDYDAMFRWVNFDQVRGDE